MKGCGAQTSEAKTYSRHAGRMPRGNRVRCAEPLHVRVSDEKPLHAKSKLNKTKTKR